MVSGGQTTNQMTSKDDEDNLHIIFSTDCKAFQHWQSLLLFASAARVGQRGKITRIASGCNEEEKVRLSTLYKELYKDYTVHFTPDFKTDAKTGKTYHFYNKPLGLAHWLKYADPPIPPGRVIALLDPDMIFMRPLTHRLKGENNIIVSHQRHITDGFSQDKVVTGKPVAQKYGLGAPWAQAYHRWFNRTALCGPTSPCMKVEKSFGESHYAVGPPYIATREDFMRIAKTWVEMVPRVYEKYPFLLAEMYAYSMAAAHEELPHLQVEHLMVSNAEADDEGWLFVDSLDDVCEPPNDEGIFFPGRPLPTLMHYCQGYTVDNAHFQKRAHPDNSMFQCDSGFEFKYVPVHTKNASYNEPIDQNLPRKERNARKRYRRGAFAACIIHRAINAAVQDFRNKKCTK